MTGKILACMASIALMAALSPDFSLAAQMTTDIPPGIAMPGEAKTRIGTLRFHDGLPDDATLGAAYENLGFVRAVHAFLTGLPGASMMGMRNGYRAAGTVNGTIAVFEDRMDSRSLYLSPNSDTVYALGWLDLSNGPLVVEVPAGVLGGLNDAWSRYVGDMGIAGADKGAGGRYLIVPPGYKDALPDGYAVLRSPSNGNLMWMRAFLVNGDPAPGLRVLKEQMRIYPLSTLAAPTPTRFINMSGKEIVTVFRSDIGFFRDLHQMLQEEPIQAFPTEFTGLLAALGIEQGKPFPEDEKTTALLTEAAIVGNATARAIAFRSRDPSIYMYPESGWYNLFTGGSHEFTRDGHLDLDAQIRFFYTGTGVTPAMAAKMVGVGSQYAWNAVDSEGRYLDGGKTYRLHLPANPPAKNFWAVNVYDTQTRSQLQTDQRFPSISSNTRGVRLNTDGSIDIHFGPVKPSGNVNWIQTLPGKGWWVGLRMFGPLEPWFDKTWRPGEIVPVVVGASSRRKTSAP
jgi:hypothetical protein